MNPGRDTFPQEVFLDCWTRGGRVEYRLVFVMIATRNGVEQSPGNPGLRTSNCKSYSMREPFTTFWRGSWHVFPPIRCSCSGPTTPTHTTRKFSFKHQSSIYAFLWVRLFQKKTPPTKSDHSIPSSVSRYPMSSAALFRLATRTTSCSFFKASYTARPRVPVFSVASSPAIVTLGGATSFSTTPKWSSASHEEETFEEFSAR